jgi:2-C-methyl-D-erythritol 4-phosphate cytidylyltransferase/2-C-methyl-D-erythritol 2,4-cyclodiphosphate synthase
VATQQDPEFVGIVVAAGKAVRVGGPVPKQFAELGGRSVLERSVRAIAERPSVAGVIVVLPAAEIGGPRAARVAGWPGVLEVVAGGASRALSVRLGLDRAGRWDFVLVHDAARPMLPAAVVDRVVEATRRYGAAVPGVEVSDTVKRVDADGVVTGTEERSELRLAQTPQGARRAWLLEALLRAEREGAVVTDEAAALERSGRPVRLVEGDPANRKITTAGDLESLRRRFGGEGMDLRVGSGFDVHHFETGRPLILGGLRFEGETGLAGHSDADVVLHAAMDALLGAAGMGDIGMHFPPDDPRFKGADSAALCGEVARMLGAGGFEMVNLDLTLLAERPKIRPRADEMRDRIAGCLGLPRERVGLKATTLEGLGALGRGEGIACQAVALLRSAPAAE